MLRSLFHRDSFWAKYCGFFNFFEKNPQFRNEISILSENQLKLKVTRDKNKGGYIHSCFTKNNSFTCYFSKTDINWKYTPMKLMFLSICHTCHNPIFSWRAQWKRFFFDSVSPGLSRTPRTASWWSTARKTWCYVLDVWYIL